MGLGYGFLPWLAWAITLSATGSAATAVILDPSPEQLSRWQGRPPAPWHSTTTTAPGAATSSTPEQPAHTTTKARNPSRLRAFVASWADQPLVGSFGRGSWR